MSDYESDLLTGLAQHLDDAGAATYRPAGGYLSTETAIVFGDLPTSPDRAVALSLYASRDLIEQNLSMIRVQVMMRGAVNSSLDLGPLAVAIFDALHAAVALDFGTAHVVQCQRISTVPLGMDGNKRYLRADSYELDVNTPARTDRP